MASEFSEFLDYCKLQYSFLSYLFDNRNSLKMLAADLSQKIKKALHSQNAYFFLIFDLNEDDDFELTQLGLEYLVNEQSVPTFLLQRLRRAFNKNMPSIQLAIAEHNDGSCYPDFAKTSQERKEYWVGEAFKLFKTHLKTAAEYLEHELVPETVQAAESVSDVPVQPCSSRLFTVYGACEIGYQAPPHRRNKN